MISRFVGRVLAVVALTATALCLGWAVAPGSPLFALVLTPHRMFVLSLFSKLLSLLLASLWSYAVVRRFETDNPARPAWCLLGLGMLATLIGQLCLAPAQIVSGSSPFPSVADLFFVLSYPFLAVSFVVFLRAYQQSGLPLGSRGERLTILGALAVVAMVLAVVVVKPVLIAPTPLLERALNAFYPIADLVLLLPLALLFSVTTRMRGGQIGRVWSILLSGFVFMCAADVFYAFYSNLGLAGFDPWLHAAFILAYWLVAAGVKRQLRLLSE